MPKRPPAKTKTPPSRIAIAFAWASFAVLVITTILWSYWGSLVHHSNADQLVNSYLFDSGTVFKEASLPGQHTFLLKWPLLYLVKLLGSTPAAFSVVTVLSAVITVAGFAFILYRIERRPLNVGLLFLGLASVLLLVPAAPYAGGLLPVNMAMVTTRNIEYLAYLAGLVLLIRSRRLRSPGFWLASTVLAFVIASDKLFLSVAIGSALIGLLVYAITKGWNMVSFSAGWLVDSLTAGLLATILLAVVSALHITNIVSSGTAGPYTLVQNVHDFGLGLIFGAFGLFTNLGANPVYDTLTLRTVPHNLVDRIFSVSGPGYVLNLGISLLAAGAIFKIVQHSLEYNRNRTVSIDDRPTRLSILLILSSLAAGASFVVTNHYYPVDARYLTIALFTVFVCLATYGRKVDIRQVAAYRSAAGMLVIILLSTVGAWQTTQGQRRALDPIEQRNKTIVELMQARNVRLLVGDYWRVIPIRQESKRKLRVTPLADCTAPRDILSSRTWQPDLQKTGFAYLLSLDKSLTGYPNCSLEQITAVFGRPNKSSVVAGTTDKPTELLLFYDSGIHVSSPTTGKKVSTVFPVNSSDLPDQVCNGPTVVQTIAHQDDDLLFMNPDLMKDIRDERCIRTIYLTAGDAGSGSFYWLGREKGAEHAYSTMLGGVQIWVERTVKLKSGQFVTIANPRGNQNIQLIFMHLPDGNINGRGFPGSGFTSLEKLNNSSIRRISSVDGQSSYSRSELVSGLAELFEIYRPTVIRTQSSLDPDSRRHDHSDHITVGRLTQSAYDMFEKEVYQNEVVIPIEFYTGYANTDQPANVSGEELEDKDRIFSGYTKYDPATCSSNQDCWSHSNYQKFLPRQYRAER